MKQNKQNPEFSQVLVGQFQDIFKQISINNFFSSDITIPEIQKAF